jgi:hypothetical protein
MRINILIIVFSLITTTAFCQRKSNDYLIRVVKEGERQQYGFKDRRGKLVIPYGRYNMIFTDTFRNYAVVIGRGTKMFAIDRKGNRLFDVFQFDNGPDEPSEGLFRIVNNGRIGFANTQGKLVIAPDFQCAYPFENGTAKVSRKCTTKKDGEHSTWQSNDWYYIDKTGKKVQ